MIEVDVSQMDISKFIAMAKGRTRAFALEFIQDLNQAVVEATPVRTGFLRGSWYAALNGGGGRETGTDMSGALSVSRLNLVAAELKLGDVFNVVNGAVYAARVEYGTAHMAPRAFVRGTVDRAPQIAEAAARRVGDR